ncbi:MAG: DUF4177 domain-containing protein [Fulvimarina manganoxydans]|uniref:hypothetical protein n=1 Tax=Fulvimarina manganoxydans TaxID=937218 RepID=UPI002355E69E|nr:hypothetical protein [Fulvimarina manganoxydans]MCK5934370.1 DUF4177 domain-containing protein [Fulvimarina manganoxydans]
MTKFEYRVETMKAEKTAKRVTETLNALGANGWELVSTHEQWVPAQLIFILKRQCA